MMAYGSAKNAVHYYIQSLGACTGGGISATAAGDIYTNLKTKSLQQPTAADEEDHHMNHALNQNSGSGSRPLYDSKLVRQAGRSVRKDIPSYDYLTVVGLLPTILDTPQNRQMILHERNNTGGKTMKKTKVNGQQSTHTDNDMDEDESSYMDRVAKTTLISPHDIVHEIGTWITTPALRPHSGALIKVVPNIPMPKGSSAANMNATTAPHQGGARFELVR